MVALMITMHIHTYTENVTKKENHKQVYEKQYRFENYTEENELQMTENATMITFDEDIQTFGDVVVFVIS